MSNQNYIKYLESEVNKTEVNIQFYKRSIAMENITEQKKAHLNEWLRFEENLLVHEKARLETALQYQKNCVEVFGNDAEPFQSEDCDVDVTFGGRRDD